MHVLDVENQADRNNSSRRVMRYIPEVTADNLPSRIRLEPRYLMKDGSNTNSTIINGDPAQSAVKHIQSGKHILRYLKAVCRDFILSWRFSMMN